MTLPNSAIRIVFAGKIAVTALHSVPYNLVTQVGSGSLSQLPAFRAYPSVDRNFPETTTIRRL